MIDSRLGQAIDRAFGVLGEHSRQALVYHLRHSYNIDIYHDNVNIEKLESALQEMIGDGKDLLLLLVNSELHKM